MCDGAPFSLDEAELWERDGFFYNLQLSYWFSWNNNERYRIQKGCQALVFKTLQQKWKVVVKDGVMAEMCEPQAASSFLCCPWSSWDQLCAGATQAGFSERSRKQHLLSFGIFLLNHFYMATCCPLSSFALKFTNYGLVSIALQLTWKGEWQQLSAWWCLGRSTWEAPVFFLRSYRLRGDRRVKLNSSAMKQACFY